MRKLVLVMASVAAFGATTIARAEQAAPVDYDCALFNECGDSVGADRGATKGFSMAGVRAAPEVTARPVAAKPAMGVAPTAQRPKLTNTARPVRPLYVAPIAAAGVDLQLTFVTGSAELTPGAKLGASRLAEAMQKPGRLSTRFMIEGHTDSVGSRESNLDLSRRRAQSVVNFLAAKGVDTSRFDVAGYGSDRPLEGTSPANGANRRVVAKAIR
jgi:OmpA-OmpF porin, OOP family